MNHENDSNEAKLIIKMRQMDQNEWVECAKIIQSQLKSSKVKGENFGWVSEKL